MIPNPRETEFGNFIKMDEMFIYYDWPFYDINFDNRNTIYWCDFMLSDEAVIHERVRVKFVSAIGDLGGLYAVTIAIFAAIYYFFAEPYRKLHLAVSFNRMKNQICR